MRIVLNLIIITLISFSCMSEEEPEVEYLNLPYPPNEDILFYQAEADSGYQTFWTDIKATTSAYLNNSKYDIYDINQEDIIIVGEGLFRATVEVEMRDFILVLRFEKPNKSIGDRSIWQIKEVKEKPWPEKHSGSKTLK